jgi:diguanylate cyclase (GGDEF)-like protein
VGGIVQRPQPRALVFAGTVLVAALALLGRVIGLHPTLPAWQLWLAVPLVVVMARWPVVVSGRVTGDLEIALDPTVLVFLALMATPAQAALIWGAATAVAQLTATKAAWARLFNLGVVTLSGVVLIATMHGLRPSGVGPGDLLASAAGVGAYFTLDYMLSAAVLSLAGDATLRASLWDAATPVALVSFSGVSALGFVAAVLARNEPWALPLMAIPLATVVLASRAFSRAHADRVRVRALFQAAEFAHREQSSDRIAAALTAQAAQVLRCTRVRLADAPGDDEELSAAFTGAAGQPEQWLVASRRMTGEAFDNDDRQALLALATLTNESLRRARLVTELAELATHDPLTGLANRTLFNEQVRTALADVRLRPGLLFCDLDGFKAVNDTLGHEAGDELLSLVAERFRLAVRDGDLVARIGGDEFAVLMPHADSADTAIAERLHQALAEPASLDGRLTKIGASIGIALAERSVSTSLTEDAKGAALGVDASRLVRNADVAMYRAKATAGHRTVVFAPAMLSAELERHALAADLPGAAARGELVLHYQPVMRLLDGGIEGVEALVRWQHPTRGLLAPGAFLDVAEQIGCLVDIGAWVVDQAIADGERFAAAAGRPLVMAVNLSGPELRDARLIERLATANSHRVRLLVEIVETELITPDVLPVLEHLRAHGVWVAIDDFGTGHSSIARLSTLNVHAIKLDRAFVAQLTDDSRAASIVRAVLDMAQGLGLVLVAEGIETAAQAAVLQRLGCTLGQGFHLCRPAIAADVTALLAASARPVMVGS